MPRIAQQLTASQVSKLKKPGLYGIGHERRGVPLRGLYLFVRLRAQKDAPAGALSRSWVLRYPSGEGPRADADPGSNNPPFVAKRKWLGLGAYPRLSLDEAIAAAWAHQDTLAAGGIPVGQRAVAAARRADERSGLRDQTFRRCAERYIATKRAEWKKGKHEGQWEATLATYVYPHVGHLHVNEVTKGQVLEILEPIWTTKTVTATRLRGRIEAILDWAKGRGYRSGDNPAAWRGNLETLLPNPRKVAKKEHHEAVPVDQIGAFMQRLRQCEGQSARALEFVALTAARSGEVRGMTWGEVDLQRAIWTVPGARTKSGREHRVPLSRQALQLLREQGDGDADAIVFESPRGGALSDMSLTAVTRRMGLTAVPHGLRSTFRDWAGDRTSYPRDVCEAALGHVIANQTEAAYRRSDALERRRPMMQAWADFCDVVQRPKVESIDTAKLRRST